MLSTATAVAEREIKVMVKVPRWIDYVGTELVKINSRPFNISYMLEMTGGKQSMD